MNPLNKYVWLALALFVVVAGVFFGLWRYEVLKFKQTNAALISAQAVITEHEKNIALAERTNHAYQDDLDRLNATVERLRSHPPRCVTVTSPSGIPADAGQGGGHASQNGAGSGISSAWLYDYASECEKIRIERNSCKDFVNEVWKEHGEAQ